MRRHLEIRDLGTGQATYIARNAHVGRSRRMKPTSPTHIAHDSIEQMVVVGGGSVSNNHLFIRNSGERWQVYDFGRHRTYRRDEKDGMVTIVNDRWYTFRPPIELHLGGKGGDGSATISLRQVVSRHEAIIVSPYDQQPELDRALVTGGFDAQFVTEPKNTDAAIRKAVRDSGHDPNSLLLLYSKEISLERENLDAMSDFAGYIVIVDYERSLTAHGLPDKAMLLQPHVGRDVKLLEAVNAASDSHKTSPLTLVTKLCAPDGNPIADRHGFEEFQLEAK